MRAAAGFQRPRRGLPRPRRRQWPGPPAPPRPALRGTRGTAGEGFSVLNGRLDRCVDHGTWRRGWDSHPRAWVLNSPGDRPIRLVRVRRSPALPGNVSGGCQVPCRGVSPRLTSSYLGSALALGQRTGQDRRADKSVLKPNAVPTGGRRPGRKVFSRVPVGPPVPCRLSWPGDSAFKRAVRWPRRTHVRPEGIRQSPRWLKSVRSVARCQGSLGERRRSRSALTAGQRSHSMSACGGTSRGSSTALLSRSIAEKLLHVEAADAELAGRETDRCEVAESDPARDGLLADAEHLGRFGRGEQVVRHGGIEATSYLLNLVGMMGKMATMGADGLRCPSGSGVREQRSGLARGGRRADGFLGVAVGSLPIRRHSSKTGSFFWCGRRAARARQDFSACCHDVLICSTS